MGRRSETGRNFALLAAILGTARMHPMLPHRATTRRLKLDQGQMARRTSGSGRQSAGSAWERAAWTLRETPSARKCYTQQCHVVGSAQPPRLAATLPPTQRRRTIRAELRQSRFRRAGDAHDAGGQAEAAHASCLCEGENTLPDPRDGFPSAEAHRSSSRRASTQARGRPRASRGARNRRTSRAAWRNRIVCLSPKSASPLE